VSDRQQLVVQNAHFNVYVPPDAGCAVKYDDAFGKLMRSWHASATLFLIQDYSYIEVLPFSYSANAWHEQRQECTALIYVAQVIVVTRLLNLN
jgi:hypothetical protein